MQSCNVGLHIYGFRVAEPQHDGTSHWHLLFFISQENVKEVGSIIRDYAMREDGDEPGRAERVNVWGRLGAYVNFQQIGRPAVTLWRELRRHGWGRSGRRTTRALGGRR
ncbi:replication endonuclease [Nitrosospira sp. Nsp13]|uniref:replication endonuclease n=1 Tax=Nitrosospira sp. Nsp13 TaxID=1855332 RepID=UPI000B8746C5|nr:replication endonuclease [Nitrosospira sp. Nsp13]